ncbi:MAG: protein kinase [Gemmatimonadetes bacterium]|nr:protein kinase [Gemmatimonadota bacterium]
MPTDDFTADLSKLDKDYQILTELHRTPDSRTYLARHLELNRDVTITVFRAATGDKQSLSSFAGDVARLKTSRHPNVIPVIEGRWLGDGVFAVARARVRGSTLDQLLSAVGPVPLPRVAGTLGQVRAALDWARSNGIANREVAQDSLIFQQGSGRVLLSLEPAPAASSIDPCEDARTIGRLGWEMLSGQRIDTMATTSLAMLRPELSPAVVAETEALVRCDRNAPRDVGAYIAMLGGTLAEPTPLYSEAVSSSRGAVVAVKPKWSFNARLATAVAVGALAVIVALFFMSRRDKAVVDRTANSDRVAPAGEAAGDVAMRGQPDTSIPPAVIPAPIAQQPTVVTPTPVPIPVPVVPETTMRAPAVRSGFTPPETRRHEPPRTAPVLTMPIPADSTRIDTSVAASAPADVCSSPSASDQRRCLSNSIDRNDAELNGVYQRLIAAMRRQANVTGDDPDPDAVERLRSTQRRWLDDRDQACHTVGSGALWARDRAQCFADQSAKRARDLQQMLDAVPPA